MRLEPADEYTHELGPEPNFNESMYINLFDPEVGLGGFFRLGNRANEGQAEMTVCLYLPDGRVGFMFKRPPIMDNAALDAGGLTWTMVRPFEELRSTTRASSSCSTIRPRWPTRRRRSSNPFAAAEVHPTFTGQGRDSMFGGEPDRPHEAPGEEFARGHYEQLVAGRGTITVGDEVVGGHRPRAAGPLVGPRFWQAPWYYRWLTANAGPDFGFMASRVARRDGPGTRGGFVWEDGRLHLCDDVELTHRVRGR